MASRKEYSVNLALPSTPYSQNAELFGELLRVYNAIKNVAAALDTYTGMLSEDAEFWNQLTTQKCLDGLNTKIYLTAGEALAYGNTVGIKSDGKAWKAQNAVLGCIGYCRVVAGVLAGETVEVQLRGIYPAYPPATLTPGNRLYQSGTAGTIGVSGTQCVGFAISDTVMYFNPQLQY